MPKPATRLIWPLLALAVSSCATQAPPAKLPVQIAPPSLAPPPASVMVARPADFRQRLLNFFSTSPTTPTASPNSSPPARE